MEFDWNLLEQVTKVAATVIGTIGVLSQAYVRFIKSPAPLMRDVEILKLLDHDDPNYALVRARFDNRVSEVYGGDEVSLFRLRVHDGKQLIFGLILFTVFGYWTYSLSQDGSGWAFLTGFMAFGSAGNVMGALGDPSKNETEKEGRA